MGSVTYNVERMPYLAHKLKENTAPIKPKTIPDSELFSFAVLPVISFNAFFGGTAFSKKILSRLPKNIIIRDRTGYGISRYKVSQELIWEEIERREE